MTAVPTTLDDLARAGVIAVLRAPTPDAAVRATEALLAGGVSAIEVTYSTPGAAAAIRTISERFDQVLVGAGTLTKITEVAEAVQAGARFLVSPGTAAAVARAMVDSGRVSMTGALTPTEVMAALDLGADAIKIFPGSLAGPSYLKALRGPFPDVPLMPTGGVSADNLGDWLQAGAVAVGAGSELCGAADMAAGRWDAITENARRFSSALAAARN